MLLVIPAFGAGAFVAWLWERSARIRLQERLEAERRHNEEKQKLLLEAREELTNQFQALSQKILDEKSQRFTELNKSNLEQILAPFRERIGEFQKQVTRTYDHETRDRTELKAEIRQLKALHEQMSKDAKHLTSALKGDSQARGSWGETILKRVFETSGLTEGREYELQVNLRTEDGGSLKPDAVVHLPEGRDIVVDAKVSLTDYERYHNAEDDEERKQALDAHLRSIRSMVDSLGGKEYQNLAGVASLDFVLMFVPVEGAYIEAVRADPELHDYALRRNVVLLSPSNMLPTLRVVEHMWRQEKQNRNAQTIAEEAGKLYDKFVNFVKDVERIGQRLTQAQNAYDDAHKKLTSGRGNLVGKTEGLKKLGARTSKRLDTETRAITDESGEEPEEEQSGTAE